MKPIIYPYKVGLNSTRLLREAGCAVRYDTSRVRQGVAIAWGNRTPPPWSDRVTWINDPASLVRVSNKWRWAETCSYYGFGPTHTQHTDVAQSWAGVKGRKVLCRTLLNASRGRGIVVARNAEQVVDAPLYSVYFKKNQEYRVIMTGAGEVVYFASKRRPDGLEMDRDAKLIRTSDSGYVYQTEETIPYAVLEATKEAAVTLSTMGLHLLAYDVGYNSEDNTACVFEANSAPGLNEDSAPLVVAAINNLGETL